MFQKLVQLFLQKFTKNMGRGPQNPAEWMQIQDEAVRYLNKTKGAPSITKNIPGETKITIDDLLKGPVRSKGPKGDRIWDFSQKKGEVIDFPNKGIRGLIKKGDVQVGKAPKTTKETLDKKKDRGILLRDADEARAEIRRKNKQAVEDFKKKFHKTENKYLEDLDNSIMETMDLTKKEMNSMSSTALDDLRRNADSRGMQKHFGEESAWRGKGDFPDDPFKKDPDKFYAGGLAPLVGEPSYAADFYDDRTPMKKGRKVKKKKKTAAEVKADLLKKLKKKGKKIPPELKRLFSPFRQLPHGRQRYRSIKDLPEGILALLEKDPGFDREAFEKAYWAGEGFRHTDPGWSSGMRGQYSPMTGAIELNLAPFGEEEYPYWKLRSPHQNPTALRDIDKAKIALHELRHKNIMEDPNLFRTQPEWVQRSEGAGYLPKGGVTGHELYNRFLDKRYYPPEEDPGPNDPYFDKILKDYWEPYAKDYESTAKRRLSGRHGEGIETLAAKGGRIGLAGGGLLKKFIEKLFIKASNDIRLGRGKWKGLDQKQRIVQHDNLTKKVTEFQKSGKTVGMEEYFGFDAEKAFKYHTSAKELEVLEKFKPTGKGNAEGGRIGLVGGGAAGKVWKKFVEKLFKEEMTKPTWKRISKGNEEWAKRQVENYNKKLPGITKKYEEFKKTGKLPEDMHVDDLTEHGISNNEYFRGYDTKKLRNKEVDYDYYREILDDAENEIVRGDETLEHLEALVKEQDDYHAYMYDQYKTGKLEPKAGEVNRGRLNLLRERADSAYGDPKMFTHDDYDELEYLEDYFKQVDKEEAFRSAEAKEIARGKASGSPWFTDPKILSPEAELRKEFPGIDDRMIKNILTDKNPQRIAEVKQTMREALTMQQKGMSPEGIIKTLKDTTRKKQASGGIMREGHIFGGSAGLKAMWKQMMKSISKGRDKPVKRLFPTLSRDERRMEKLVMGTPEQKAFREGEVTHKLEGIDILINRMKHDKKIIERQAKNKAMKDEGLDFVMKHLEKDMPEVYGPHLKKYTDIDKDILQLENIKKNLIMKDRKLNAYGGRIGYAGGGQTGLPAVTLGQPQGPAMQQPQMPAGPQPAGIPGGTIVAQNQMQQSPWMGSQMQQGIGGMQRPQPGGMPRPMAAEGGRIGFGLGGFNKARRAFLKMLAGLTAGGVAAGTGLLKLGKAAKVVPKVTETAEVITRGADGMPAYVTDLIEVVKAKGTRDFIEGYKKSDYSTVHSYKGVDVIEDPVGNIKIKSDKSGVATDPKTGKMHEGIAEEHHMQIERGETIIKDEGLETQKAIQAPDEYIEGSVRPDMDGKMKDFEDGLDEAVHLEFKKIADEIKDP